MKIIVKTFIVTHQIDDYKNLKGKVWAIDFANAKVFANKEYSNIVSIEDANEDFECPIHLAEQYVAGEQVELYHYRNNDSFKRHNEAMFIGCCEGSYGATYIITTPISSATPKSCTINKVYSRAEVLAKHLDLELSELQEKIESNILSIEKYIKYLHSSTPFNVADLTPKPFAA